MHSSADIAIVGGGVMGCSIAYHLALADPTLAIVVIERDPTYARASSALSLGNVRVQFSLPENIAISQHAFAVLERFADEMEVEGDRPEIGFRREGNLFLVDRAAERAARSGLELQRQLGCRVEWWSAEEVERRFPLLTLGELAGGTFGIEDGHLDGYALLMGYRRKAASLGCGLLQGEVTAVQQTAAGVVAGVELADGGRLDCGIVVNCAGAWAATVAATIGLELPVSPVQRQVFVAEPAVKPEHRWPLISLPGGLYFRSEGDDRIVIGKSLPEDRIGFDFQWRESRFTEQLWPELVQIVPSLDRLRLERGWTGLYAVNQFDGNALLGEWRELTGLYLACGFSGHGLQQAPAVGRYLSELILDRTPALDLSVLSCERLLTGRRVPESALV